MDWKTDIGNYFVENNVLRIKYLNDRLMEYCKEYIKYLNEFMGITAKIEQRELYKFGIYKIDINVEIIIGGMMNELCPFKMSCYFDEKGKLCLKYSDDYNDEAEIKNLCDNSTENKDFQIYSKEEITEPEKVEKEYLFQLFNNRLKQFIDLQKAKYI